MNNPGKDCDALSYWLRSPLGEAILQEEQAIASAWLRRCYGYHALQMGVLERDDWLSGCMIPHRIGITQKTLLSNFSLLLAEFTALPLLDESVDLICLPHSLDYCVQPELVLQEALRTLIPAGKLLIFGFNKISLLKQWRLLSLGLGQGVPCIQSHRLAAMENLVENAQFTILKKCTAFHNLPINNTKWQQRLRLLDKIGQHLWPNCGGIYAIYAEKRMSRVTPIKPRWIVKKQVVKQGLSETTSRGAHQLDEHH